MFQYGIVQTPELKHSAEEYALLMVYITKFPSLYSVSYSSFHSCNMLMSFDLYLIVLIYMPT